MELVLGIETSCDDTSAAIVRADGWVSVCLSANQNYAHSPFGGIVPEIASRNHTDSLMPLIEECLRETNLTWADIDGIAVTAKPGLIGSLLVGVVSAKCLALALSKPLIGVNHLEGHLLAPFLRDTTYAPPENFAYPYVALAISGGHTSLYRIGGLGEYKVLGRTLDDAAGECFDKFGKMLGLGFPGGVQIDRQATKGRTDRFLFPRPMLKDAALNFSFSGMKTAGRKVIEDLGAKDKVDLKADLSAWLMIGDAREGVLADLCAGFQEAMVDLLLDRLRRATESNGLSRAVLTGGVSANSRLRARALEWAKSAGVDLVVPPIRYCTDNAAMIGYTGIQRLNRGERSDQTLAAEARAPLAAAPEAPNLPPWLQKAKS